MNDPSYIEKFPFNELSSDLQSYILSFDEQLELHSLVINKAIYSVSVVNVVKNRSDNPISIEEVNNYLKLFKPLSYAKIHYGTTTKPSCSVHIAEINLYHSETYEAKYEPAKYISHIRPSNPNEPVELGNFVVYLGKCTLKHIENSIIPIEYDLLTMYYCYANRTSCTSIDTQYAKKKVLELFESDMHHLDYEDLLVVLRANSEIMGIRLRTNLDINHRDYPEYYRYLYNPNNEIDKRIISEVKELGRLIRKRLKVLD